MCSVLVGRSTLTGSSCFSLNLVIEKQGWNFSYICAMLVSGNSIPSFCNCTVGVLIEKSRLAFHIETRQSSVPSLRLWHVKHISLSGLDRLTDVRTSQATFGARYFYFEYCFNRTLNETYMNSWKLLLGVHRENKLEDSPRLTARDWSFRAITR